MPFHERRVSAESSSISGRHQRATSDNDRITDNRLRKSGGLGQICDFRDAAEPDNPQQELHYFRLTGMSSKQLANLFGKVGTGEAPQAVLIE